MKRVSEKPRAPLRLTRQRKIIMEELCKVCTHPTADELYTLVRKRLPHVSLATVYRNLEFLSEIGRIRRLEIAGTQRRYDGNMTPHYHIRCTGCDRVDDIFVAPHKELEKSVAEATPYTVTGHRLEFMGECPKCNSA